MNTATKKCAHHNDAALTTSAAAKRVRRTTMTYKRGKNYEQNSIGHHSFKEKSNAPIIEHVSAPNFEMVTKMKT